MPLISTTAESTGIFGTPPFEVNMPSSRPCMLAIVSFELLLNQRSMILGLVQASSPFSCSDISNNLVEQLVVVASRIRCFQSSKTARP